MAGLYFTVGADFTKLQKLKSEIDSLKAQLRGMNEAANPKEFKKLEKQLQQLSMEFDREALAAQRAGAMTSQAGREALAATNDFDKLKRAALMMGGTTGLFALGREIKNVRGEIEYLEKSFEVLLGGSKAKADALISSLKQITLKSNYSLTALAGGAQTLMGFNVDEKQVIPVLEQIGNIAMGNTDRFKSLILAFAQMSSTGKLMGQDLLQMINAGFNPLQVIAEKTGKTIVELKEDLSSISSEMVADAFRSAATEGGKFAGMMESQADAIKGAEAKLSGAIQDTFNDIGKSHSDIIKGGYDVATSLVQNYQTVGEILVGLVATYGLYKTAIMTTNAIKPVMLAQTYQAEAAALTKLLNGEQAHRISQMGLVKGSVEHVAAIKAEIAATAESTKVKLAEEKVNLEALRIKCAVAEQAWMIAKAKTQAAKEELAVAISTAQAEAEASLRKKMAVESEKQSRVALRLVKLQEQKDAAIAQATALKEKAASDEKIAAKNREIATIQAKITAARQEEIQHGRNVAAMRAEIKAGVNYSANKNVQTLSTKVNTLAEKENAAATAHSGYIKQMVGSKLLIKKLSTQADTAATVANTAATTTNTVATSVLTAAKTKLMLVAKNLWATLAPNPYLLAAAAVVALGYGIYKLATYQTEAEKAQTRLNESVHKFRGETVAEQAEIDRLFDKLKNTNKESSNYQKIKDEITSKYGSYLAGLKEEIKNLNDVEAAYRAISKAARQSAIDRAIASATQEAGDSYAKQVEDINKKLKKELQKGSTGMSQGAAEAFLETINMELEKTGRLSSESEAKLKQFTKTYTAAYGTAGQVSSYEYNPVEDLVNKMVESKKIFDDTNKEIIRQFGYSTNEYENLAKDEVNTYIKFFEKAIDSFNKTGNKQTIQLFDKTVTLGSEEELTLHLNKLKEARDNFDKGTPTSQTKNKAYWEKIKKEAEGARDALDEAEKGGQKWKELTETIKNSEGKIKNWESPTKAGAAGETAAEKARKEAQKYKDAKEKQSVQEIRAIEDLENQLTEAEIRGMDEGSEKVLAQLDFNYKKEKQAIQRQQEDALKTKRDNARAIFEADEKNKGKTFNDSSINLTEQELNKYKELQKQNDENYQKDKFELELQYMRDFIQEYGTFQQKRLSIAQEYDKRIAASKNEWEKKSLANQKQAALKNADFEAINKRIDWQGVFGNMTGMLESQLKETLSGLKDYIKTDQFKASSDTDKKTVYDAIEKLRSVTPGGEGTLNFNVIRQQMDDLGAAINSLQQSALDEKAAHETLSKAHKKYEEALKSGNQAIIESAKIELYTAQASADAASAAYKNAEANIENLGNAFKETATDTIDGLNLVGDGLSNFASNSLPQLFKGLQSTVTGLSKLNIGGEVGKAIGNLSKTLSSAGVIGQIISAVLSILDVLKDGIGTLIANLIDTVLNAVDGILSNLLSGKMFSQIFNSLKDGIGNILNTISFGGFKSALNSINGSNAKETAETISRLTTSNEALKVSVDALKDEMAGSNGMKSIEAYNEAVNAQQRYNENLRNILNSQMGYHNNHHSNAYYWKLNSGSMNQVNKLLGTSLRNTWEDFSKLTADQMNDIRTHLPDIWSEMINQGKYGDRFKDDWNNYANQAGKVGELTEDLRENIAQISFESLRDSFVDTLMDMDADASDFAGDFEEYLTKALLNFAIGDILDNDLKQWYNSWTDTMNKQGGKLTDKQIEQYQQEYLDFAQKGIDKRNEIAALTGYTGKDSTSQQASKGVYEGMSQDTGERLEARNTAIHMTTERMDVKLLTLSDDVRNMTTQVIRMSELTEQSMHHMEEIRTIQLNSFYELRDINNNTQQLYQMNERMGEMNDKLSRL